VLVSGLFRLGWIANLLSIPVTTGFLAGIAVHILASQLPSVLGVPSPAGSTINRLVILATTLGQTNVYALAIGLGVFASIVVSEAVSARIPSALIGLAGAAIAVAVFGLQNRGVAVVGTLPSSTPHIAISPSALGHWRALVPLSLLIAIVVMVQTAATTQSFLSDRDEPAKVDRDFVGAGAGSLLAGLIGAFPVNASPPRTGIVAETGGRSQASGLLAVALVIMMLGFGARLLAYVPEAALGGVLLFVATRIFRLRQMRVILRQTFGEFLLVIATAAAIIVLPIEQGVVIGIILSLLHGLWSTTRSRVIVYERVPGTTVWWPHNARHPGEREERIVVAGFQAPLSFLNASGFRSDLMALVQMKQAPPALVVIEASGILDIDFTAAQMLIELIKACQRDGIRLVIARLESERAQQAVRRYKIGEMLGKDRIFLSVEQAIRAAREQETG
jgi:SulP family sulfate permease